MDFTLNDEQQMFKEMVRKFCINEVEPLAAEIDLTHEFPMKTIKKWLI